MKWLIPLGFLGLLGLLALLIIYLIKPNYQKKGVSSTYVWKLSLRFRKKKKPISRLQDIFLLICQVLAIVFCTFAMAQPVLAALSPEAIDRKIVVIDGSVSMLAETNGVTRFERAVDEVRRLAKDVTAKNGEISVILAGETAQSISIRTMLDTYSELDTMFDDMAENYEDYCCHGSGDVNGAMKIAEEVLDETPEADVLYYTSKNYYDVGEVEVVNVSNSSEYNVAILDSVALLEENYYTFAVDIASYGRDVDLTLYCEVYGVNFEENSVVKYSLPVWLEGDESQTVNFNAETTGSSGVYAYDYAYIYVSVDDSFYYDNMFYIYGGTKETIRIQYASSVPNIFFRGSIMSIRETLRSRWNIEYVELNTENKEPETEGFDFYIFERVSPKSMPKDGIVFFVNPENVPAGLGINVTQFARTGNMFLTKTSNHPIVDGIIAENIFVSQIRSMTFSDDYEILLTCYRTEPALAVRNDEDGKIVVMSFELQNSDASITLEFPKLFFNIFEYFFPSTITRYNFEVGETVQLNARADSLAVSGQGEEFTLTKLPSEIKLSEYGTYTLSQTLFTGETVVENFYVKIPNAESDFVTIADTLVNPYVEAVPEEEDYDLILFIAGALVFLLFLEWWLSRRTQ